VHVLQPKQSRKHRPVRLMAEVYKNQESSVKQWIGRFQLENATKMHVTRVHVFSSAVIISY